MSQRLAAVTVWRAGEVVLSLAGVLAVYRGIGVVTRAIRHHARKGTPQTSGLADGNPDPASPATSITEGEKA